MAASRGAFILFEGVDRCGKSTQSAKLAAALAEQGLAVASWNFPDRVGTTTGAAINDYLAGRLELSDTEIHELFSRNRWEKTDALLAELRRGTTLVVDRYAFSGVAYSAAKGVPGLDVATAKAPDVGLPAPDLVVYLRIAPAAAASRAGYGEERYERAGFQAQVLAKFEQLMAEHQQQQQSGSVRAEPADAGEGADAAGGAAAAAVPPGWLVVDASQPVEAIHAQVVSAALATIRRCAEGAAIRRLWDGRPLEQQQQPGGGGAGAKQQAAAAKLPGFEQQAEAADSAVPDQGRAA